MRLLFITGSLTHGGAERHTITLLNRLAQRGHDCHAAYVQDNATQLERLWRFIGVAPERVNGAACELHVLGHGSRLKGPAPIRVNEGWRSELSAQDLRLFDGVAGTLSRELGYR